MPKYFLLLLVTATFNSCTSVSLEMKKEKIWKPFIQPNIHLPKTVPPVKLILTLSDDTLSADKSLAMTLTIYNTSQDSVEVAVSGGSTVNYDFVVLNSDSTIIWNRLPDGVPLALIQFTIGSQEEKSFSYTWDLVSESGNKVEKGTYFIFGGFLDIEYTNKETSQKFDGPAATKLQKIIIE